MPQKKVVKTKRIPVNRKPSQEQTARTIPLLLYRRIALIFVVLVAMVLITVLYLATMQAVIRVKSVSTEIPADFVVRTVEVATTDGEVQGEIQTGSLGRKKMFTPRVDSQTEIEAQATGQVTITNITSSAQPLVTTTRLITTDGTLFRLKRGVTVPAQGSTQAEVYADKKGAGGNIGPSSFTIPGLNSVKQKLITASSDAPMTGGIQYRSALSQQEIDQSIEDLKSELLEDAKIMLREQRAQLYKGEAFFVDVNDVKVSAKAGEEVESFDVEMQVSISGVFYDDVALKKIAERKLYQALGQGQEYVDFGEAGRTVTVQQISVAHGVASIHVRQKGRAITSRASRALEVDRFVGKSTDEVKEMLIKDGVALDVEIEFFPFWVRTVPRLKDRIYVEIR